jgi:DnaJ-class molecular chaperone
MLSIARLGFASSSKAEYAAITTIEKDYYSILGIPATSTPEQIKDAYRSLVKKFHPDARAVSKGVAHEPNVEKFRNVVEAYSVLSVRESRVSYDLTRKKNPDSYKVVTETQYNMENRRELRNKAGVTAKAAPLRGSYAEERLAQLKKERAKYNVNYLGYYQGGNP